jgi:hypothetical protein
VADRRWREREQWQQDFERRQALMARARAFVEEPPPSPPRRSKEEYQAELDALSRFLDREAMAEQDRLARETEQAEGRRLWDFQFRQRYDRAHPRSGCDCPGHRAWQAWRRKD